MNADKTKTTPKVFAYLRSSAFIGGQFCLLCLFARPFFADEIGVLP